MPKSPAPEPATHSRVRAFAALTLVCIVGGGAYVAWAVTRHDNPVGEDVRVPAASREPAAPASERSAAESAAPGAASSPPPQGIVFQHVKRDRSYAHLALTTPSATGKRRITRIVCERAHLAARRGLCLRSRQGLAGPKYDAMLIDRDFKVRGKVSLPGILSRARVSPDGRYGATTGFVTGHSYADLGKFSTHTTLIEMAGGRTLGDLEDFTVTHNGRTVDDVDRNFWGVTFARDSDRFYATMRVGTGAWLIEGSVRQRRARTLHLNVECPSLSPDGTRVAYKKKAGPDQRGWRLHVLDLRTMKETALAERRSVDDQAEWLDDDTVLYGLSAQVWSVRADGGGRARKLLSDALSPAVLR